MSTEEEIRVAVLEERVKALESNVSAIQLDIREKFDRLEKKLDDALKGRVSWGVAFIFTALSTIATSLIVYELTR